MCKRGQDQPQGVSKQTPDTETPLENWFAFLSCYSEGFSSVQFSRNPMDCSTPGLPVHHQLLESTQPLSTESVMPSNHLILCHPLLRLPSIFPSIRVFSSESVLCIRWPRYWSFSFSIRPSNEYSGQISFRIDWLDCLAVQGPLKESSPTPQFKSINSMAFSFLYTNSMSERYMACKYSLPVYSLSFYYVHGLFDTVKN